MATFETALSTTTTSDEVEPVQTTSNPQDLVRLLALLQELRTSREAAVVASGVGNETDSTKEDTDTRIVELQQELLDKSAIHSSQTLAIQRIQLGSTLEKILYDEDDQISPPEKERIEGLVKQQQELSTSILALLKHQTKMKDELESIQTQRRELIQNNQILMKELMELEKTLEHCDEDEATKRLGEEIDKKQGTLSIIQHVLQGLIVGSGINWAKDPELQEVLLSLSRTDF